MPTRIRTAIGIGILIRTMRMDQNLRQDELAGVSGSGARFIVKFEANKPTAQTGKVLQALQILGAQLSFLLPGERGQ